MKTVVVTAAVIRRGDKYLIAQRKKGSHQGLKWEFPGGKLEHGEHPEDCLQREIREELGVEIEVKDIFQVVSHVYEQTQLVLLCYLCDIVRGEPCNIDCHAFRWVTAGEMDRYEFAPADKPVVAKIRACSPRGRDVY